MTMFAVEEELTRTLWNDGPNSLFHGRRGTREISCFRELSVGPTTPDLVYIAMAEGDIGEKAVILSALESWVTSDLLQHPRSTPDETAARLFARPHRIVAALARLQSNGIVSEIRGQGFVLRRKRRLLDFQTVAIEAKLTRWRQAIQQAKAYLAFSHMAYVALPEPIIKRNGLILDECRAEGLGLIAVNHHGIAACYKPTPRSPSSHQWVWVISKTVGL